MGRRKGERILGPYAFRPGLWQVVYVSATGDRKPRYFKSERRANKAAEKWRKEISEAPPVSQEHTTETALELYKKYLQRKGNKDSSVYRTCWSVGRFFPRPVPLWGLSKQRCKKLYEALMDKLAVDSHRNVLAEVKTFLSWCVGEGFMPANPAQEVKGIGRRRKGKTQLKLSEARAWFAKAMELACAGDVGALAALLTVVLGVRCTELVTRTVDDLDTDELPGDLLWIARTMTEAGTRYIEVPEGLRQLLLAQAKGKKGWLFPAERGKSGRHTRDWPTKQVQRICALAGVGKVSAHGMRGLHARLALRGTSSRLVAMTLGHEDERTTVEAYAGKEAAQSALARSRLRVLKGG